MSQEVINRLWQGLEVTIYGLLGVFGVLVVFYVIIILLGKIPERQENEADD